MPQDVDFFEQFRTKNEAPPVVTKNESVVNTGNTNAGDGWGAYIKDAISRFITPTLETWNPNNMAKGLGSAMDAKTNQELELAAAIKSGDMDVLNKPISTFDADLAKGLYSGVQRGGEKIRQGDWAGGFGEGAAIGSQFWLPKAAGIGVRAGAKATGLSNFPEWMADWGLNTPSAVQKNFPDTDFGRSVIDSRISTQSGAKAAGMNDLNKIRGIVNTTPGTVDSAHMAGRITQMTEDAADMPGRGAHMVEGQNKIADLQDRYLDRWNGASNNNQLTANDLYTEKVGQGNMATFSRDRLGATTADQIDELWKQSDAAVAKDELNNLTGGQTNPLLKHQQDMLALQNAFQAGGRRSNYPLHLAAGTVGTGVGAVMGSQTGNIASGLTTGLLTTAILEGMMNPSVVTRGAIAINDLGRIALSGFRPVGHMAGVAGLTGREQP